MSRTTRSSGSRPRALLLAASFITSLAAALAAPLAAQQVTGYTRTNGERQRQLERAAAAVPSPERSAAHSRALSAEPHVAGTPGQARTRDYVIEQMKAMGLETEVRAYDIWLPHPTSVRAWRVDGAVRELDLREGPVVGDSTLGTTGEVPPINGYAGSGDVTGELVFVNYGLIEDYAQLAAMGISVRGKIAIARYGRSFRGIKAREAEKNGAIGLLIYSDPQDDGYARGDVYPEGPMRPPTGIQRGGVANGNGDPSTPGWPSVAGARRLQPSEMNVPRIPVIPVSYGNAALLLRDLRGHDIPAAWQGGLPFRYHIGPGPVRARLAIATDTATRAYKTIWNTFGTIRGSELPDELVIIGAHRDAWGPGAADNVSGTVSVLESARAVMEQVLIGSTEYVEQDSLRLLRGAVAYLNQDVSAQGSSFGGGGSPSLRGLLRDVVRQVDDPKGGASTRGGVPRPTCRATPSSRRWVIRGAVRTSRASTTTWASRTPTGASVVRAGSTTRCSTRTRGCRASVIPALPTTPPRRAWGRPCCCASPTPT
jgi:N-acetylated-alpha-linked acidic dipeptidase